MLFGAKEPKPVSPCSELPRVGVLYRFWLAFPIKVRRSYRWRAIMRAMPKRDKLQYAIDALIEEVRFANARKDRDAGKRIRAKLRRLGHRGGTGDATHAKSR